MTRIRISLPASSHRTDDEPIPELVLNVTDYRQLTYELEVSCLQSDQTNATYSIARWYEALNTHEMTHSASISDHYYALRRMIAYANHRNIATIDVARIDESATPPAPTRIRLSAIRPFGVYEDASLPELMLNATDYRYLAQELGVAYLDNNGISHSQSVDEWRNALDAHESTYHEHITPHESALRSIIEYADNHGITTFDVTHF